MQEGYQGGGGRPKRMTQKQIREMINNMKKSSIVNEKSNKYHKKESIEAEDILKKIDIEDK